MYGNNTPNTTYGYIGQGSVLMSLLDANDQPTGGFFNAGTCSSATCALNIEKVEMKDSEQGQMAVIKSTITAKNGDITVSCKNADPELLALHLFGDAIANAAAVGATHTGKAYVGRSLIMPGFATAVTSVTTTDDVTTYTEGTDYVVSDGTLYIPVDSTIPDASDVKITYDKAASKSIEGFIKNTLYVQVVFAGLNVAQDNDPVKVTYHKVALDPTTQRNLISTDYSDFEIKGKLMASNAVSGTGISKLFKEEFYQAA